MPFNRKWRPNASQRKAFAEKMQDPTERAAYLERKAFKNSYEGFKDRSFIPTKEQYEFAMFNRPADITAEQQDACNQITYGFSCQEKIHHDYIHIVNEMHRAEVAKQYN